jgi:hypothetical protein
MTQPTQPTQTDRWCLFIGIERAGDCTSRDVGDYGTFASRDEAIAKLEEMRQMCARFGYQVMYAILTHPNGSKETVR